MKKIVILFAIIIGLPIFSIAQNSFPTSNAIWNVKVAEVSFYGIPPLPPPLPFNENVLYCIEGDTTINDTLYSRLYNLNYKTNSDTTFIAEHVSKYNFLGGIREENQEVWFRMENQEYLLYDFGASVGDTVWHNLVTSNAGICYRPDREPSFSVIQNIQIIDGIKYLYTLTNLDNANIWIEGMGGNNGLFGHLPMYRCLGYEWVEYSLGCFKHNDTIKYISCTCGNCFYCPFTYPLRVMIDCQGEQWSDTIYFSCQTEPVQVDLLAWMPPIMAPVYIGIPPFTYLWTTNSKTYTIKDSTISNPTFSFLGEVTVYLKVADACGYVTYDTLTLSMNKTGISDYELPDNVLIFPNPTNNVLHIEINGNIEIKAISIYNIDGKLIEKNKYSFNSGQLNIGNLAKGSYTINIETAKGIFTKIITKN